MFNFDCDSSLKAVDEEGPQPCRLDERSDLLVCPGAEAAAPRRRRPSPRSHHGRSPGTSPPGTQPSRRPATSPAALPAAASGGAGGARVATVSRLGPTALTEKGGGRCSCKRVFFVEDAELMLRKSPAGAWRGRGALSPPTDRPWPNPQTRDSNVRAAKGSACPESACCRFWVLPFWRRGYMYGSF